MRAIVTLLLICLTPPAATAGEIRGQVFIVLKSGSSVKLALAEVYQLSPAAIETMDKDRSANLKKINAEGEERMAEFKADEKKIAAWTKSKNKDETMLQNLLDQQAELKRQKREIDLNRFTPPAELPPSTLSDADGNFTTPMEKETAVILIRARRGEPEEYYVWWVDVRTLAPGERTLFSIHNMAASIN